MEKLKNINNHTVITKKLIAIVQKNKKIKNDKKALWKRNGIR